MSGILIAGAEDRVFLHRMIDKAPVGAIFEMRLDPASEQQRKKMWAMLGEVSKQIPHVDVNGNERFYAAEQWKLLMMHACGQEVEMMPSLDGSTFLPYEGRSSKMRSEDMNQLLAFIEAWGVQNGVVFKEID